MLNPRKEVDADLDLPTLPFGLVACTLFHSKQLHLLLNSVLFNNRPFLTLEHVTNICLISNAFLQKNQNRKSV